MARIVTPQEFGPVSEEQIRAFEAELGSPLPRDYREFLLEHNGGIPAPENFTPPGLDGEMTVETFFGLHDGPPHVSLLHHVRRWGVLLPDLLPIGYEQGGSPICLRLRGTGIGEVSLWDVSVDELSGNRTPTTFYSLAPSFREFLESLV